MLDSIIIDLLETALSSPDGIAVSSSDVDKLRQKIYAVRRKLSLEGDNRFTQLSLTVPSSSPNELWIVPTETLIQERQQ